MQIDEFLIDVKREEKRFRVKELLFEGDSYQIALAEDVVMDNKLVCVKTINYDLDRIDEKKYVGLRRKALHEELVFLSSSSHLLPDPLDWIQVEESDTVIPREPVLVYEYIHGDNLFDLVQLRFPEGMNAKRATRIIREVAVFLQDIHSNKYAFRDLNPRHIIVGYDDIIHIVGCGNSVRIGEKLNPEKAETTESYAAPEIRKELSGKLIKPASDLYALGALFSFLLTGIEPRAKTESPLTRKAYDRLKELDEGYQLLVARLMMPLAKQRFGRVSKLLPYLHPSSLPQRSDAGFGIIDLPRPWSGNDPENRAANSSISSGPLISVDKEREAFIKGKLKTEEKEAPSEDAKMMTEVEPKEIQTTSSQELIEEEEERFPNWLIPIAILLVLSAAGLVVMFAI